MDISFHVNVADKLDYGCRLLRKAYASGAQVAVTAEPSVLQQMDELIWRFSALDFIPHCALDASGGVRQRFTPVLLTEQPAHCAHHEVLINLGLGIPPGFEGFARLIEVVADKPAELQAGRQRWKHYTGLGHVLTKHDRSPSTQGVSS
ncbi:DNA polymerase III subunit chi [Polaromonas sp.]|nr:DNA polymerase III subunit chi [Polaromonas sp.]